SRRRHTRFSRDWSSDVCSSDLGHIKLPLMRPHLRSPETGLTKGIRLAQCRSFELPGDQIRRTVHQETFVGTLIVRAEQIVGMLRSEERRVGKECRSGW